MKKNYFFISCFIFMVILFGFSSCENKKALLDQADTLIGEGKYDEASDILRKLDSDSAEANVLRSYCYAIELMNIAAEVFYAQEKKAAYDRARDAFDMVGDYRDAEEKARECRYKSAGVSTEREYQRYLHRDSMYIKSEDFVLAETWDKAEALDNTIIVVYDSYKGDADYSEAHEKLLKILKEKANGALNYTVFQEDAQLLMYITERFNEAGSYLYTAGSVAYYQHHYDIAIKTFDNKVLFSKAYERTNWKPFDKVDVTRKEVYKSFADFYEPGEINAMADELYNALRKYL